MTIFYSKDAPGFFDSSIHSPEQIPVGSVEITAEQHIQLINGQVTHDIVWDEAIQFPVLKLRPGPTAEQIENSWRAWRNIKLSESDSIVARHRDEAEEGSTTTLSATQYTELQAYRRALRNWPETEGFPDEASQPAPPNWLEQLQ